MGERALAVRHVLGRLVRRIGADPPISSGYRVVEGRLPDNIRLGWRRPAIMARQQRAFEPLLDRLRAGAPRQDFIALAEAVRAAGVADPRVIEVGCATGWNGEVLERLLDRPVRYVGIDYSSTMVTAGARRYPRMRFAAGDAARLPVTDGACDVVISGTVLMHVLDYASAIDECRRVTRRWAVFHSVPVLRCRHTTTLTKLAYGVGVVEVVFNEVELLEQFRASGFVVRQRFESVPYDLAPILGEPTASRTFLCEKQESA
ncbi:MAG TPA: methyltransferase domain-containing protein [Vicinamibacterales bacterium]|nr:methyltransferase domain-containing protein [Vicinamibacterales bacterium]